MEFATGFRINGTAGFWLYVDLLAGEHISAHLALKWDAVERVPIDW